ncbi:tRNA:m(4)X modification enzyme TRM13 homolog [Lycaon pictus]
MRKASEGLNSTLKDQIMSHPALHDALNDPKNGDSATKHLKQQILQDSFAKQRKTACGRNWKAFVWCGNRCDWRHYVGKEYFRALGLGAVEFHYFQRMSSWATCGMRKTSLEASNLTTKRKDKHSDASEEHDDGGCRITDDSAESVPGFLTVEEKKKIGHLCKLLIDQGRVEYLQQKGFSPALQYYTDPLVSLENVLLTALPNHSLSPETTP